MLYYTMPYTSLLMLCYVIRTKNKGSVWKLAEFITSSTRLALTPSGKETSLLISLQSPLRRVGSTSCSFLEDVGVKVALMATWPGDCGIDGLGGLEATSFDFPCHRLLLPGCCHHPARTWRSSVSWARLRLRFLYLGLTA